jgi:hypothetical protein
MTMDAITNVRDLVKRVSGPLATVYCCPFCTFHTRTPKGRVLGGGMGQGRGYGLAQGSRNQAAVVAHIKAAHADKLITTKN